MRHSFPCAHACSESSWLFRALDSDDIAETHGVHKLKTIGDAYIACAGAFGDGVAGGAFGDAGGPAADPTDAAHRVACMGLAMAAAVDKIAGEKALAVTARIGIHTGTVIGGIIGTVRYRHLRRSRHKPRGAAP